MTSSKGLGLDLNAGHRGKDSDLVRGVPAVPSLIATIDWIREVDVASSSYNEADLEVP